MKATSHSPKRLPIVTNAKTIIITVILVLNASLCMSAEPSKYQSSLEHTEALSKLDIDILALTPEIKAALDTNLGHIKKPTQLIRALHKLMFDPDYWGIQYSENETLTAQQVYETKLGNCISLASLYIASARYLGLKAQFQSVQVPREEQPLNGLKILRRHVNALVTLRGKEAHVEFLSAYLGDSLKEKTNQTLSDKMAFAQFHNNLAMEEFAMGDFNAARNQLNLAINYHSKFDYIWSNFGVVEKFLGNKDEAEKKYRRALRINKNNFSALANIYLLLSELGRFNEADTFAKKVKRLKNDSPYYFAKIARIAINHNRPEAALKQIDKGLIMGRKHSELHHLKAKALYDLGKYNLALDSIEKAIALSENEHKLKTYRSWIEKLQASSTS